MTGEGKWRFEALDHPTDLPLDSFEVEAADVFVIRVWARRPEADPWWSDVYIWPSTLASATPRIGNGGRYRPDRYDVFCQRVIE